MFAALLFRCHKETSKLYEYYWTFFGNFLHPHESHLPFTPVLTTRTHSLSTSSTLLSHFYPGDADLSA